MGWLTSLRMSHHIHQYVSAKNTNRNRLTSYSWCKGYSSGFASVIRTCSRTSIRCCIVGCNCLGGLTAQSDSEIKFAAASARFDPFTANDGVGSSSVIVIVAAALEIVEFEGLDKVTVNVSFNFVNCVLNHSDWNIFCCCAGCKSERASCRNIVIYSGCCSI